MIIPLRSLLVLFSLGSICAPLAVAQSYHPSPQPLPPDPNVFQQQDEYAQQIAVMQSNPMLWQQYQALQGAVPPAESCQTCGTCGSDYDRCGCNPELFRWIDGPGMCDSWCVGPRWAVEAAGLYLFRDNADWDRIVNDPAVIANVGATPDLLDQFDHAPGARLFMTAYNEFGYGLQVGYEGAESWTASLGYDPPAATFERTFTYETRLHSVEINLLPSVPYPWKLFSGFRYIEIDEDLTDFTTNDKPIPPPASGGTAPVAFVDTGTSFLLENRLIGFQLGGRRDSWQFGRWLTLDAFANAGVYCNKFKRENVSRNVTTIITGEDLDTPDVEFSIATSEVVTTTRQDFAEIAFAGEAGVSAVARLNQCLAVRGGYQLMVVDGMGEALDAFFAPELQSSTVLYHGLQFGLEYRR